MLKNACDCLSTCLCKQQNISVDMYLCMHADIKAASKCREYNLDITYIHDFPSCRLRLFILSTVTDKAIELLLAELKLNKLRSLIYFILPLLTV